MLSQRDTRLAARSPRVEPMDAKRSAPPEARIEVRAKPGSSRSAVVAIREGVVDIALAAPPVDGAANDELVRLLARVLDVPRRDVAIVRGHSGRTKLVAVVGLTRAACDERLAGAIGQRRSTR